MLLNIILQFFVMFCHQMSPDDCFCHTYVTFKHSVATPDLLFKRELRLKKSPEVNNDEKVYNL